MKKFICGFLCGAVLCTAIGAFAVNSIYENPYKITVNGAEKAIQGYNIDDYSYFKLRDIADAVGGFNVDFDNDTIVLSTDEQTVPISTPVPLPLDLPLGTIPDPIYTQILSKDGDYNVVVTNDEFNIPIIGNDVPADYIADKANEMVGEELYTGFSGIIRKIGDLDNPIFDFGRSPSLEQYYLNVAPWLRTLK